MYKILAKINGLDKLVANVVSVSTELLIFHIEKITDQRLVTRGHRRRHLRQLTFQAQGVANCSEKLLRRRINPQKNPLHKKNPPIKKPRPKNCRDFFN